jgi:hypothetical protein
MDHPPFTRSTTPSSLECHSEQIKNKISLLLVTRWTLFSRGRGLSRGRLEADWKASHSQPSLGIANGSQGALTVYRLFRNEAFEPEAIVNMTRVYADVCQTLGLSDANHGETTVVAAKVIEFAQRGARDPILLRDCVLEALRG